MENISTNITFSKAKFLDSWVQLDQEQVSYKSILKKFSNKPETQNKFAGFGSVPDN